MCRKVSSVFNHILIGKEWMLNACRGLIF
jgi:hypothetical protein